MNKMFMQIMQGAGVAVLFIAPYIALNQVAMMMLPQFTYYFDSLQILLMLYVPLFFTLTTYYRSCNQAMTYRTLLYSFVGSSLLVGSYFFIPTATEYVKMIATLALPALAIYNYFSSKNC